jgi:hypothetical protein
MIEFQKSSEGKASVKGIINDRKDSGKPQRKIDVLGT